MKNEISLFSAIAISIMSMIGSGWLFSAQLNAKLSGNYSFIAWLISAFIAMAVGLCFSKLCSIYPEHGLNAKCVSISHGKDFGMVFSFAIWFGLLAIIPTEAQATIQYLSPFFHSYVLYENNGLTLPGQLFAIIILIIFFIVNYFGIKILARINNVATVLRIFIPLLTIITLLSAHFDKTNFSLSTNDYTINSIPTALIGAGLVYAFNGFQVISSFASEIKNPGKNIPKAMLISILSTLILYLFLQFSFMGAVPHEIASEGWLAMNFTSPLVNLTLLLGLHFLTMLLITDSIFSPSITGLTYLGSCSRMLYAMAEKGQMPKWIAKICPTHHLSKRALSINFFMGVIILLNSTSWTSLMIITTSLNILGYMGAPISLAVLQPTKKTFTKFATMAVFVFLSWLLSTLSLHNFLLSNTVITVIMIFYGILQYYHQGYFNIYSLTFVLFLWILLLISRNIFALIILSSIVFWFITEPKFINYLNHIIMPYRTK